MRKLTIALMALATIAAPALAQAANQPRQTTPITTSLSTTKNAKPSKAGGKVASGLSLSFTRIQYDYSKQD